MNVGAGAGVVRKIDGLLDPKAPTVHLADSLAHRQAKARSRTVLGAGPARERLQDAIEFTGMNPATLVTHRQ